MSTYAPFPLVRSCEDQAGSCRLFGWRVQHQRRSPLAYLPSKNALKKSLGKEKLKNKIWAETFTNLVMNFCIERSSCNLNKDVSLLFGCQLNLERLQNFQSFSFCHFKTLCYYPGMKPFSDVQFCLLKEFSNKQNRGRCAIPRDIIL